MRFVIASIAFLPLAACGFEGGDRTPLTQEELASRPSATAINFGDDSGDFTHDGECDDPRFKGPGMTPTPLMDDDRLADATDCRDAYNRGELALIG
ncbi:MAG: hypothetical protein AAFY42_13380 [Pseudomonadota bacterium]